MKRVESSRVEFYVTTDSQSASISWNIVPIWGLRPDFYYCQTVSRLLMWDALSDKRTGLSFTVAVDSRQRSHFGDRVPWTRDHLLLSQIRDFPFVASYGSQGYGGGIRLRLHTGYGLILQTQSHSQIYVKKFEM
jgi:hypothetical protein